MKNPFIWFEENNLEKDFCDHCISKFESDHNKYNGVVGTGTYNPNIKQSTDLVISILDDLKKEDNVFYESIHKSYDKYQQYINSSLPTNNSFFVEIMKTEFIGDTGYQIQRTAPSEFYSWHSDAISNQSQVRTVTFIWYLNTIDKLGYTEFWDGTKIKPEQGKLLIFPATWNFIHRGVSPKSQNKYICTGWLHYSLNSSMGK